MTRARRLRRRLVIALALGLAAGGGGTAQAQMSAPLGYAQATVGAQGCVVTGSGGVTNLSTRARSATISVRLYVAERPGARGTLIGSRQAAVPRGRTRLFANVAYRMAPRRIDRRIFFTIATVTIRSRDGRAYTAQDKSVGIRITCR